MKLLHSSLRGFNGAVEPAMLERLPSSVPKRSIMLVMRSAVAKLRIRSSSKEMKTGMRPGRPDGHSVRVTDGQSSGIHDVPCRLP